MVWMILIGSNDQTEGCLRETWWDGVERKSESECKCLTCNQKPTGSQFSLLHEPN